MVHGKKTQNWVVDAKDIRNVGQAVIVKTSWTFVCSSIVHPGDQSSVSTCDPVSGDTPGQDRCWDPPQAAATCHVSMPVTTTPPPVKLIILCYC